MRSRLLTIPEVLELFSISRRTLDRLRNRGEICGVRVGGQVRFEQDELERFMLRNKEPAIPESSPIPPAGE